MPWAGNGNNGFTLENIPRGWIVCDGRRRDASDFQMLASMIGETYGGSLSGEFPNIEGEFFTPNLTSRVLIDLDESYLANPNYQMGQGDVLNTFIDADGTRFRDLLSEMGTEVSIKTSWSANCDIDFQLPADQTLVGKFTELAVTGGDFQTSVTTLNRKLGINHFPSHGHADKIQSATAGFIGPMTFSSTQVQVSGNAAHPNCSPIASTQFQCALLPSDAEARSWQQGRTLLAFYGDEQYEHTLPTVDRFWQFNNADGKDYWSKVPAPDWNDGAPTRESPAAGSQSYNFVDVKGFTDVFPTVPEKSHSIPAWTGLMPKPMIFGERRNFFGKDTSSTYNGLIDNPEDPSLWFTVANVPCNAQDTEFTLPPGTDIRTTKVDEDAGITYYAYDKIRPWKMVDGLPIAKGTYITEIEREGTNDSNYSYTVKLSRPIETSGTFDITFLEGSWPTSMSNIGENEPDSTLFLSHNHGTFDIQMSQATLKPQETFTVNELSIGSVSPDNLNDALNITVTTNQPSLTIVYIIRAY